MTNLSDVAAAVRRCSRCGFCQEVCPTYAATGYEWAVARGRMRLVRHIVDASDSEDAEAASRLVEENVHSCILCGACTEVCPSAVPTTRVIAAVRAELGHTRGWGLPKRIILRATLASPRRLAFPAGLLRLYRRSGLSLVARRIGFQRLAKGLGHLEAFLPPSDRPPLRLSLANGSFSGSSPIAPRAGRQREYARSTSDRYPRRARVAYFLGCVTDNFFPAVGEGVIRVLEHNGYEVVVPQNSCCGMAHIAHGDPVGARRLAQRNLSLLLAIKADFIVSDCASCLDALKEYGDILDDPDADSFRSIACKIRDVSQLLVEEGFERPEGSLGTTATYHDPCHLARGFGVRLPPRQLLSSIPGLHYRELPEADHCCGGGGLFGVTHREISLRILDRKMAAFDQTEADVLCTSCPSCMLQLGLGLRRAFPGKRLAHPVELLMESYLRAERADN